MKEAGVRCDTHIDPGGVHGFFNSPEHCIATLAETDKFLSSLGWIQPRDEQATQTGIKAIMDALPPFRKKTPSKP